MNYKNNSEFLFVIISSFIVATIILHLALLGRKSLNKKVYIALVIAFISFIVYAFNYPSSWLVFDGLFVGLLLSVYTIVVAIAYKVISSYFKAE